MTVNLLWKLRNRRDERGAVLVIATAGIVLAMVSSALAVDLGRLASDKRTDQKVADLAALDAVRKLPLGALAVLNEANSSADRNDFPCTLPVPLVPCTVRPAGFSVTTTLGIMDASHLFAAQAIGATAVQVKVTSRIKDQFAPGVHDVTVFAAAATGNGTGCFYPDICERTPGSTESSVSPLGTVRVGSSIASVSSTQSTILNRLLTNTVGGTYSLSAASWQGIASGNVKFSRLRTALGYSAGTPSTVLDSNITFRNLLDATVTALNADGSPSSVAASTPLATIRSQVAAAAGAQFTLRRLFDIVGNVGGGTDVAGSTINVLDVVRAGLVLADADHFAQFDLLASSNDLPLLQVALPNFISARVKFGLIEAPQEKSGPQKTTSGVYRTIATTSQVRLLVTVTLQLNVVGIGIFNIDVPYYFDAGSAEARLDTLHCSAGASTPTSVDILGVTQAVGSYIGSVTDPNLSNRAATPTPTVTTLTDVNLAGLTHVKVNTTSVASVSVAGKTALLNFTPPYDGLTSKPVPGTALTSVPVFLANGSQLSTTVTVAGLLNVGLTSSVTAAVISAVTNANIPLVSHLYVPVAKALGLTIGGADVWAPPVQTCAPTSFNTDPTTTVGTPGNPNGTQNPALTG